MRRSSLLALLAALAVFASFAVVGTVLANHLPANHNITTLLAKGTLGVPVKYNVDDIKVQTKAPVDVVVVDVTFAPGASAGWHNHPGPVFVVVQAGTISVWDEACVKHQYGPLSTEGASFFEPGPAGSLLVKNESTTIGDDVHIYATFLVPVGTSVLRTGTAHLCGIEE
jgi:quercetin dioxygenase-like cupin family protein